MKKVLFSALMAFMCQCAFAYTDSYTMTRSTFNSTSISVGTTTPVLVNKPGLGWAPYFSITVWNAQATTMTYTLSASSTSSGSPALTCANGGIIPAGTAAAPASITEQFHGLYMWVLACASETFSDVHRVIRGR